MKKKRYAKALLQDKNCDNCDHYAIEFNGIESCVVKVTDVLKNQALELPPDRACDNWERAPVFKLRIP